MKFLNYTSAILITLLLLGFDYKSNKQTGSVKINFKHFVQNELLELDTKLYRNDLGQTYTISKLKYYISGIKLKSIDGKLYTIDEHFLINEEEENSKLIHLQNVSYGYYDEISFLLGVDSLYNCSGAQSGTLDPINGMFWSWNSGYIFLKLEGHTKASPTPSSIFEYHIGGYKKPYNSIKEIKLKFPKSISITENSNTSINISVAVEEILKNPNTIDFSKTPSITDPKTSSIIAENYVDIFSLKSILDEK